jgi:dienelactone hydrolase
MPGLFVTGSLFRPKNSATGGKKIPAILCPHGHWDEARFRLLEEAELKKELASGGERLPNGGRSIFQSLGVQLARMGCVAFVYDMIGYCDNRQISFDIAHKFAKQRPEMSTAENWGLFSPQAELHAQSVMGLQTWNSIRALDFLTSLPDVDPKRLGCTGASGGGTQTMLLAALDPRLAVECPAVMVSTAMQGGCTCENASLLRVDTGNIEFAALFAPKPLGMTAANDWTKEMETKGYPELRAHYAMMGAPDKVALWAMLHFGHNYNAPSREKIYGWFNQHFPLGLTDPQLVEREYNVLSREQLTVWDAQHPAPPGGPDVERKLLRWWHDDAESQQKTNAATLRRQAWQGIVRRDFANAQEWKIEAGAPSQKEGASLRMLANRSFHEELPICTIDPPRSNGHLVIWLTDSGKEGLFVDGKPRADVQKLVDGGASVLGLDLCMQGEFLADPTETAKNRRVKNPREAAAYTFGYNDALLVQRVHDLFTALQYVRSQAHPPRRISIVALDHTAPIAAVARALVGPALHTMLIDTHEFRFANVRTMDDPCFVPAAAKYGDLPALLQLGSSKLFAIGEPAAAGGKDAGLQWLIDTAAAPAEAASSR